MSTTGAATASKPHLRGGFTIPGTLRPDELASRTGVKVPEGPYETMGGFMMNALGRITKGGQSGQRWGEH